MHFIVLLGRILYSAIFIASGIGHFTRDTIDYSAMHGVPIASFLVPVMGIIAILGALSVLFGYRARLGAWLLVIFLVPVTLMMHKFWGMEDGMMASMQHSMFLKNISMLGAALLITYFGSGPLSLDKEKRKK
ncbi:MAG TPA: DoxX family protein [Rhabdochlamydiaceae bacterium]|nr:DoxX family protein [Rhabdochlamydiaceae bacterium]